MITKVNHRESLLIGYKKIDYAEVPVIKGATKLKSPKQTLTGINSLVTAIATASALSDGKQDLKSVFEVYGDYVYDSNTTTTNYLVLFLES